MQHIIVERHTVNLQALDEMLRSALGESFIGLSVRAGAVVIHLIAAADRTQVDEARGLVLAHDPSVLTAEQIAEAARIQQLQTTREANRIPLDVESLNTVDVTVLKQLGRKIAWLESEIRNLRGEI